MFKLQGEYYRMKRKIAITLVIAMFILPIGATAQTNGYSSVLEEGTSVHWDVDIGTNFTMWYTGGGYCAVENGSTMTFSINSVDDEISGSLSIGNVTVSTNDTMAALDLTLGIWPAWLTGLFVEVGQENIYSLNETAYAAAERVSGNWMNGTMSSRHDSIYLGAREVECIIFDYVQDPPGTQRTYLAYSLSTGVLVEADTSVTFGSTYRLAIKLQHWFYPTPIDFTVDLFAMLVFRGIIGGGILAVIVIVYLRLSRS